MGGYRLLRRLGSGGMADVYLAEQRSLGRYVAVKLLRPEALGCRGAVERFEQEARAAATLIHGNIVQIHEVGRIDGHHFLVEEYVSGPSLKGWLESRGVLGPHQALDVLAQVGAALVRAADRGVVHRDIKPENLLLTRAGEVKVADFGLARVITENLELTQAGTTLGTPLYMSPEQGEGRVVDARSDLYSLGATVYHLMAGRPPFHGPTSVSVVMAHIREPLVPLASLRPDLPEEVCGIVEALLAKDPADRPASPRELVRLVDEAWAALGPRPDPDQPSLAWPGEADPGADLDTAVHDRLDAAGAPTPGRVRAGVVTDSNVTDSNVRTATEHLQAVLAVAGNAERRLRRRRLATAVAAAVAATVGFAIGRVRARRADGLR